MKTVKEMDGSYEWVLLYEITEDDGRLGRSDARLARLKPVVHISSVVSSELREIKWPSSLMCMFAGARWPALLQDLVEICKVSSIKLFLDLAC